MWTAFEVLASDLWEAALNAHPNGLAELKGKPPDSMLKPKGPFTALAYPEGNRKLTSKMLKIDYLQAHQYDLSRSMGTVLREKFNFQVLQGIRDAYAQAFDDSHGSVRDAILHPCLTALSASRNVLVHRAGIVDEEFMSTYHQCTALQSAFPAAEIGKPLLMNGLTVRGLLQPVAEQSFKLIEAVNGVIEETTIG